MDSDWRKEALAKFFNASFVHVDSEGDRMTLRERVANAIYLGPMHGSGPDISHGNYMDEFYASFDEFSRSCADAAIAAFEAALLSDEVVESAARAIHAASPWAGCPFVLGVWSKDARAALQAALAAAKGTEGGRDETTVRDPRQRNEGLPGCRLHRAGGTSERFAPQHVGQ